MNKHGSTGEGQETVRVKKPLDTNTRVLDWQEIKQYRHLIISHNRSLRCSFLGLVQKPRDITEVMGCFLLLSCTSVMSGSTCPHGLALLPASHPHMTVSQIGRGVGNKGVL